MVQERLHRPLWINKYYAKLLSFAIKDGAVHYKVHISEGITDVPTPLLSTTRPGEIGPKGTGGQDVEEEVTMEDWQKEVEDDDLEEDNKDLEKKCEKGMMEMGLPFLSGVSQAGFLSANRKESGGSNLLVQVGLPYMVKAHSNILLC